MLRTATTFTALMIIIFGAAGTAHAQFPGGLKYASVSAAASPQSARPGSTLDVDIDLTVATGFHVNSNKPNDPDLIPTTASVSAGPGFVIQRTVYPAAKSINGPGLSSDAVISAFVGAAHIRIPVRLERGLKPGRYRLTATVQYQGCNATACFPPRSETIPVTVLVN